MMQEYVEMLDGLYTKLPEKAKEKSRFKPPVFDVLIQGTTTIITNFEDVANALRREPRHLLKYLTRESAAAGNIDKKRLIMKGRFRDKMLNERLDSYIREFVLCRECKKPDTSLVSEGGVTYLRCEACGAKGPVQTLK